MRKEDIIVTTPAKSVIYAIGTAPESSPKVWEDVENAYVSRTYVPGYVLEVRDNGRALVLHAFAHPETIRAKSHEQASALDALGYTLADHETRQAVFAEYSHWPLSEEQGNLRHAELAKLKELPRGWEIKLVRTTYIRMLWAEYVTKLDARVAERVAKAAATKAAKEATKAAQEKVLKDLIGLNVGFTEKSMSRALRWGGGSDELELGFAVIENLVNGYGKSKRSKKVAPSRTPEEIAAEVIDANYNTILDFDTALMDGDVDTDGVRALLVTAIKEARR